MASSVVPRPLPFSLPEAPQETCMFPSMRYELFRIASLLSLSWVHLPPGVYLLSLANRGYFQTAEEWIVCFDCGFHYGLGHSGGCNAEACSVHFQSCLRLIAEESDAMEAVQDAQAAGILVLKAGLSLNGINVTVQPSCGSLDLSDTLPVGPRRRRNTMNYLEEAGFIIVCRNAVQCSACGKKISLGTLTPLQFNTSLRYILQKHAEISPNCRFRPSTN